jgi:phage terminase Nu1 subunit (DNA packaging protein)
MKSVITKAQLSEMLGISRPRVSQFVQQGMPVRPDGRLDRIAALTWITRNIIPTLEGRGAAEEAWWLLYGEHYGRI